MSREGLIRERETLYRSVKFQENLELRHPDAFVTFIYLPLNLGHRVLGGIGIFWMGNRLFTVGRIACGNKCG